MEKIVKELIGHSGSQIYLMENSEGLYVKKINNIERNIERLTDLLQKNYSVPKIYSYNSVELNMEYIHGLDMKTYLIHNNSNILFNFIEDLLDSFSFDSVYKDYTKIYENKLEWMLIENDLPFTRDELIEKLPKILPQSTYHGDLTLENIIYKNNSFYMIDAVTIEYDSYIFDIAKMRQDLECKWFLRSENVRIHTKLQNIQDKLRKLYPTAFDDSLLILMLLRVYLHTIKNSKDYNFIMKEIKRLWK
jgi:tRNA A-37 threonylcarbamoyl transferase component Bud32